MKQVEKLLLCVLVHMCTHTHTHTCTHTHTTQTDCLSCFACEAEAMLRAEACFITVVTTFAAASASLRRVGGRWLELVADVIVSRKGLTGVLHLWQQLQCLLLLLTGVVTQQVGSCGQDGGSPCSSNQVEANGKSDVDQGTMELLVLLLQREDEFRGPVTETNYCGTL